MPSIDESDRPVWGIDVGRTGIRGVRLDRANERGRVRLLDVRFEPNARYARQASRGPVDPPAAMLAPFVERYVDPDDRVLVGIPPERGIHRSLPDPVAGDPDTDAGVREAFARSVPVALDELYWFAWSDESRGGVEVAACRREDVAGYSLGEDRSPDGWQLGNVALFNAVVADRSLAAKARDRPGRLASLAIVAVGSESTTVVVTEGLGFWSRVVPLGGRRFTEALAAGRGTSFAEAEAFKCGPSPSPAEYVPHVRDVYFELVDQLQRTIGAFQTTVPNAGLSRLVCVGETFAAPGLTRFLEQQLQRDVVRLERPRRFAPDDLRRFPLLHDRPESFTVAYGLALQGLGVTPVRGVLTERTATPRGWGRRLKAMFGRG